MNEVKNAMKFAHGRSFFLYSNGIVSPMKAMFVHEIDISGFVRWTSGWIVVFPSWVSVDAYSDPVLSHSMVWIRISEGTFNNLGNLFLALTPLNTGLEWGCFFNRVLISSVFIMHCSQTWLACVYRFRSRCHILHTGGCWWSLPERIESPHVNCPIRSQIESK